MRLARATQRPHSKDLTMTTHRPLPLSLLALAVAAALAACGGLPPNTAKLDEARNDYAAAQAIPMVQQRAPNEMKQASDALAAANEAFARQDPSADVDHLAYLARQRVAIARATSGQKRAEADVAQADVLRDKARLAARTDEADKAHRQAADATLMANDAQKLAADTQARNAQLEAQIKGLNAKKTDRGLVMTIGDVLFDTDRAQLKEGGLRNIDKLADFLKAYPQRTALVEGYTDSTGSEAHNEALSARRATSVRAALLERGVGGERVSMKGYGEAYPVAGNDSSGGRQLNRRVEIVLSDEAGHTVAR